MIVESTSPETPAPTSAASSTKALSPTSSELFTSLSSTTEMSEFYTASQKSMTLDFCPKLRQMLLLTYYCLDIAECVRLLFEIGDKCSLFVLLDK